KYTAIDARTTRHQGYAISQRKRKLVEQVFGWMKTVGLLRKLRHRGGERVPAGSAQHRVQGPHDRGDDAAGLGAADHGALERFDLGALALLQIDQKRRARRRR